MKTISRATWIVALCLIWGLSWGQQTLHVSFGCTASDGSTSTYEIWLYNDILPPKSWVEAQNFAASRDLRGATGHLATFEDATEEACVLTQAAALGLGTNQQLWIGLVQAGGGAEPAGGWGWVTGEDFTSYVNWAGGEPNNASPGEDHGTIGRFGYATGPNAGWNDEDPARGTLFGMVIEYDVAALGTIVLDCDVGEPCLIEIPSANPENNTITLPTGAGGTADIGVFLVQEDCTDITTIGGFRQVSFGPAGDMIPVPNTLCADQWIVISSELEDVFITSGVVEARFDPSDFGLVSHGCAADLPSPLVDPLRTDLVTYLPDSELWEVDSSFPRPLAPWMQDFTYACDSSRGRMAKNRYFGVGLNFYFLGVSFASDPDGIKAQLVSLTSNKLERMLEWVRDARFRKVIKQGDFRKMEEKIEGAIDDVGALNFPKARQKIQDLFDKFLAASKFKEANADGHNFQGEGIARSSNVLHMIDFYNAPYFP